MKSRLDKLRSRERGMLVAMAVTVIFSVGIAAFLGFYFSAYQDSYMGGEVFNWSTGWEYETPQTQRTGLDSLGAGRALKSGETMALYKTLDMNLAEAAVLIRTNHQNISVYLGENLLYAAPGPQRGENPGIALHLLPLPNGYLGKTLKIELTSPYADYAGRTSPIMLGTFSSLEAYVQFESLRPLIMMAMCLVVWVPIAIVGFVRSTSGTPHREQLAAGVFAVVWALYFISAEYDIFPFFTPAQRSVFCLGMYFLIPVPLSLYYYFAFERYKKLMLPGVIFCCAFSAAALGLQLFGLVDLPRIITLNNIVLLGMLYANILAVLEARNKNRSMMLSVPFLFIVYIFMLFYFYIFYTKRDSTSYYYRDFYFLLVLAILVYSIWHFFRDVYRQKRENEMLSVQERLARASYENFKTHLRETAGLKHDMKNHFAAMRAYLEHGRIEEAQNYLARYAGQAVPVTETAYSEHFLVNAVVGSLYQKAREHGIEVAANLNAVPLHIADPDLYSLLSNITDNAFEACVGMPQGAERFIRLAVTRREPYLNIRCINSKHGKTVSVNDKIKTTKTEDGHGYGLWTIERIVNAYNGMMNIDYNEDTFTVTLALKDS